MTLRPKPATHVEVLTSLKEMYIHHWPHKHLGRIASNIKPSHNASTQHQQNEKNGGAFPRKFH
jgi:hypothetical protein